MQNSPEYTCVTFVHLDPRSPRPCLTRPETDACMVRYFGACFAQGGAGGGDRDSLAGQRGDRRGREGKGEGGKEGKSLRLWGGGLDSIVTPVWYRGVGRLSPQSWIAGGHFSRVLIVLGGSLGWLGFEWFGFGCFLFAMVLQLSWQGCFGIELTCCSLCVLV